MWSKILYIGAGLHTEVINDFTETKEFIFIDSQPRTEFGCEYYYKSFYRDIFNSLLNKLNSVNFILINKIKLTNKFEKYNVPNLESTKLIFTNNSSNINYYISTSLPYDYDNYVLHNDIKNCDTLLISGHYPNIIFLNHIQKPFNLILYSDTYYPRNINDLDINNEENLIISYILKNPNQIKSYTLVDYNTGNKYSYNTYDDFYFNYKLK